MKFLIIDDTPEAQKPLRRRLGGCGHTVAVARDLGTAWRAIQGDRTHDLVVIDIALDRFVLEFESEHWIIKQGLASRGFGDLPMSGQALGLRLWAHRRELKVRYCYTTHHGFLWLPNLDSRDPEFGGGHQVQNAAVIIDKSDLWLSNVETKLLDAYRCWDEQGWLR